MSEGLSNLQKLRYFLNKLFQFESQDLDFGIYKILHYKRNEVKQFIDKLLVDEVKKQLQVFDKEMTEKLMGEIAKLEKDEIVRGYLNALSKNPSEAETLRKYSQGKIEKYEGLKKQLDEANKLDSTEEVIYNHLTLFFSRYYDKGDFISKRRFGKSEKYVVPYNGEETHFYWVNHDQYYIKSSEYFQKFSFKVPHSSGTLTVHFKLAEAKTELGNVKADENKYFILSEQAPELQKDELNIFFEFRPLNEQEKISLGGNNKQDLLDDDAAKKLQSKLIKQIITAELWKQDEAGVSLLLRKLHHYTRKNTYDFFIHKDLKGFLLPELDFYIKSELVKVDDLYVHDSAQHFENIRHNFKLIKCFKNIADTIIEFLSQIEEFQKKLWEKKKFVLSTVWVITLDKLAQWLSKEAFENTIAEVVKNEEQISEWKELFNEEVLNKWKKLKPEDLKDEAANWKKLPVDTVHFSTKFKTELLTSLSEKINLEQECAGLVIHSDNFHGLSLLQEKFREQVKCIHIDPPYNTATSGFLYKNNYKHSSWLSMMESRLKQSYSILSDASSLICHIDENEYENLFSILEDSGTVDAGTVIWDKKNPMNSPSGVATQHEYIPWRTKSMIPLFVSNYMLKLMLQKAEELIKENGGVSEKVKKQYAKWVSSNKELGKGEKGYRYMDDQGKVYQSVSLRAPEKRTDPKFFVPRIHPVTGKPCPVPPNGFSRTPDTLKDMEDKGEILFGKNEKTQPRQKVPLTDDTRKQVTSVISDGNKGKADLDDLGLNFPYCHPVSLYEKLLGTAATENSAVVVDFFPGSATTYHAAQVISRNNWHIKTILIEVERYVYTTIIPRIKKIAYSFDWKEAKPQNMNGLGVFAKYQRLEQYEEALENIEFTAHEEAVNLALQFDSYVPKYFLHFETRESKTLLNIAAMQNPWDYPLHVWDGFTYDTQQAADLVETFSYLIGLHMQKHIERMHERRRYLFIWGWHNDQKKTLVVWRNIKGWKEKDFNDDRLYLEAELKNFKYDNLYIKGQATVLHKYQLTEDVFKSRMIPA